ncbi:MAG TPA: DUF3015 family protein [Aquirhabdus sp.]
MTIIVNHYLLIEYKWRNSMLKKTLALVVISTALSVTAPAQAAPNLSLEHIYTQCGFGGIIFGRISSVLAVIANFTTTFGAPAILSGTFSPEVCGGKISARAVFIKETFPSIEQDLASGHGEHLTALNGLMACSAASSHLRKDYANYTLTSSYKEGNASANSEALFRIVNDNLAAANCSVA